jgi:hypothetical protein
MYRLQRKELETAVADLIELRPPEPSASEDLSVPAIAFFLHHARKSELVVAYKALVGLLVGESDLDGEEAETARQMYLALQRELDRQLHASIQPYGEETPLPF